CHNANNPGDDRISRIEGQSAFADSVHLKVMIHKIHMGEDLTQPYVLGLFPAPSRDAPEGAQHDFGEVRFPGRIQDCETCHAPGTYTLPLAQGLLPSRVDVL